MSQSESVQISSYNMSYIRLFVFFILSTHSSLSGAGDHSGVQMNAQNTVIIGNSSAKGTIAIGYMMDQLTAPYRIGAILLALENGQANGLLRDYNFRYVISTLIILFFNRFVLLASQSKYYLLKLCVTLTLFHSAIVHSCFTSSLIVRSIYVARHVELNSNRNVIMLLFYCS